MGLLGRILCRFRHKLELQRYGYVTHLSGIAYWVAEYWCVRGDCKKVLKIYTNEDGEVLRKEWRN